MAMLELGEYPMTALRVQESLLTIEAHMKDGQQIKQAQDKEDHSKIIKGRILEAGDQEIVIDFL